MFRCVNLKRRLKHAAPHPVSWLEIGSGFISRSALLVLIPRAQGLKRVIAEVQPGSRRSVTQDCSDPAARDGLPRVEIGDVVAVLLIDVITKRKRRS